MPHFAATLAMISAIHVSQANIYRLQTCRRRVRLDAMPILLLYRPPHISHHFHRSRKRCDTSADILLQPFRLSASPSTSQPLLFLFALCEGIMPGAYTSAAAITDIDILEDHRRLFHFNKFFTIFRHVISQPHFHMIEIFRPEDAFIAATKIITRPPSRRERYFHMTVNAASDGDDIDAISMMRHRFGHAFLLASGARRVILRKLTPQGCRDISPPIRDIHRRHWPPGTPSTSKYASRRVSAYSFIADELFSPTLFALLVVGHAATLAARF